MGRRKCSVDECTSDSLKPEHAGVTFHKVPHHTDVRPKWISLCRIPAGKINSKLLFVCSRHFLRADFCSFKGKKYMLRQGVFPSVFPWDKSRLNAIKAGVSSKKEGDVAKKKDKPKTKKSIKAEEIVKLSEKKRPDQIKNESTNTISTRSSVESEIKVEPKEIKKEPQETIKEIQHGKAKFPSENKPIKSESDTKPEICKELLIKEDVLEDSFDQHQRSQTTSPTPLTINFAINSHIEVLDNNEVWHSATINEIDYEENEILIHFDKVLNKCDEWISMTSPRLRPLQPKSIEKFEVGERCMAMWCDSRKFPATVTKKLENDSYEVLFDDGFVKIVKNHRISRITLSKPAQASPLFEPVKGTKQDRRDKKRKLNIAALFSKKPRLASGEEKKTKPISVPPLQSLEETCSSPVSQDESQTLSSSPIPRWHPTWENGKPVGIDSTIEAHDGLRKSVIVPDPRLPPSWTKHLTQRIHGTNIGKWDTFILAPDGKKFRSKQEIKNYLELHPSVEASVEMFDFSLYRGRRKTKLVKSKPILPVVEPEPIDPSPVEEAPVVETLVKEEIEEAPEEPPISLKIIFENDAYKCPIEGCGKNFRRENLALMHVKHYHSKYTKYLDSTPNVADLAYARTVGENFERSPGPARSNTKTATEKALVSATPKTQKPSSTSSVEPNVYSPQQVDKSKDSEIIKLLNQKLVDVNDIQPLPSGLPSNMYPDINLKDLLGKNDEISMRDDIHIKNLCSSRPSQGIKTLLPVRHGTPTDIAEEKLTTKRKRALSDTTDKGKTQHHPAFTLESQPPSYNSPPPPQHPSLQQASPTTSQHPVPADGIRTDGIPPTLPSAFDLAPPPTGLDTSQAPTVTPFDGVIIEGGKIIKLERMKQEEIINCTCGFMEEDGLMIQCELCLCWQHAYCNNIQKESEVPEKYVCFICQNPLHERQSAKYLHDQDWLKQGILPVASFHSKNKNVQIKRFEKLKKCHDLSGGILELREYMHTLEVKLKIASAKNHPKLYLWSKQWEKPKLPEKSEVKEEASGKKLKLENDDHPYVKNEMDIVKQVPPNDSMLMMILKSGKEEIPMLNMHNNMEPIIPRPEAAIDSDDCRLNLLEHIAHAESLVDERLDDFEKQLEALEDGMNLDLEDNYPRTRHTLQLLMKDLDTLKRFSELPMI